MKHLKEGLKHVSWLTFFPIFIFFSLTTVHAMDVTLSWNASPGATGYKLYYDNAYLDSGPPYSSVEDVEGPSVIEGGDNNQFTLYDLPKNGYRFALTAFNEYGESGYSSDAVLLPQYTLSAMCSENGSVCPAEGTYTENSVVQITAVPAEGWVFNGWNGDITSSNNPATITMDSDKSVTADFVQLAVRFNLTVNTTGEGSVSPAGGSFSRGAIVQLTAEPEDGWRFTGWSGGMNSTANPLTITMDGSKLLIAQFEQIPLKYSLTVLASGQGEVSPTSGTYETGTAVTITATAAEDWEFCSWGGDCSGTVNPQTVIMDSDKIVVAVFERGEPVINEFSVTPEIIGKGNSALLIWDVSHADTVRIDNNIGIVESSGGSVEISPITTTIYTLVATNSSGSISGTARIECDSKIAVLPFDEDFETGTLAEYWETYTTGSGRVVVTLEYDSFSGEHLLTMDAAKKRSGSLNELTLTVDLEGALGVLLGFYHKEFIDENHVMPETFIGHHNSDGVAVSPDGETWYKVQGLTRKDKISSRWRQYMVNLDDAMAEHGIEYNSAFKIRFQQFDNYPIGKDGFALDDIYLDVVTDEEAPL